MARKPKSIKRKSSSKGLSKPGASGDERAKASEVKQDSRLLSLAPEIRNQIFGYVLGGHKVHVSTDWAHGNNTGRQGLRSHSCGLNVSMTNSGKRPNVITAELCTMCGSDPSTSLNLSLLRTCRQTYADTALILYNTNEFLIEAPAFTPFMKSLSKTRKALIEHMSVIGRGDFAWGVDSFRLRDIHRLGRVVHLRLILVNGTPDDELDGLENMAELPNLEEVLFISCDKYCLFPSFKGYPDDSAGHRYTAEEFREEIL
ncbi:hypothetical protein CKM354_000980300 [Cercospora kikuchii]|uniref:DUF7730 domain-containing protein n=1 Tax=Cercospora kikuchii TaxID=84275 RepID=A0A9P3CU48_9PEZI|nr:uncharacterized protein CKM354_000980300 [Cercospora kikuchii]GIZ46685.1 hypothetical protein CKM354_000980300 [Cercospora kikuchii]